MKKTKITMLVSALNIDVYSAASDMNLESDAIIINQCDENTSFSYKYKDYDILCINMDKRGVGLSRNTALEKASSKLILFADDDIVYNKGYAKEVISCFEKNPEADILLFNVKQSKGRNTYHIERFGKVSWHNYGRYPAYAIAARTMSLKENKIKFSLLFGGGALYSNGEDSLFLHDALKKRLKIYHVPVEIGYEKENESTWFKGYTDKFFFDRGILYHYLYGSMANILALRFLFKNKQEFCKEKSLKNCFKLMNKGIKYASVQCTDYPYATFSKADKA